MKETITIQRKEELKKLNRCRRQIACLLQGILDRNKSSDEFYSIRVEIETLRETLEKMAQYEDELLTNYYE